MKPLKLSGRMLVIPIEPARQWSGSLCDVDPDNCWIDDETGEHVDAVTCARTAEHPKGD